MYTLNSTLDSPQGESEGSQDLGLHFLRGWLLPLSGPVVHSWKMKWQLSGLSWGGPWSWEHRSSAARAGGAAHGGLSTMAAPPEGFLAQDDIF